MNSRSSRERPGKPTALLVIAASFLPLLFLCWFADQCIEAHLSLKWPETKVSRIETFVVKGEGRSRGKYFLEVVYRYQVGDQEFVGSRFAFGDRWSGSEDELEAVAAGMSAGVPVRYDPSRPQVSVLLPGRLSPNFLSNGPPFFLGFLIFLTLGVVFYRRAEDANGIGT